MSSRRGFSILELLVVIVLIGTLTTIAYTGYNRYLVRARVSEALRILDEYKAIAISLHTRSGEIRPYDVLFTAANLAGYVSGTPEGSSAVKQVNLNYVDTVSAYSGTDSGNTYLLLGAGMQNTSRIVAGADHIYIAGIQTPDGVLTWSCGASDSRGDNMPSEYLPDNCQSTLP